MTISMYQASAPRLANMLRNLDAILAKAQAHAAAKKIDPAVLLSARLFPDMLPMVKQVQIATDHAKGCVARLAGVEVPKFEDTEQSFDELRARIARILAFVESFSAAQIDGERLAWIFRLFPAVEKFWNHPAGKLSGGQKQMLAVSRAIVEPRELLIVDEPSKGLAPSIINNMIDAFQQLKASGATILLVEQNLSFARRLGDHVAVMDNGRVVHAGRMQALAEDEALQQRLLGLSL